MSGTKNELVDSVNAVAGKLDAAASELDALRQTLTELGTSYETAASQAGVWADAIRSYADTMRDGWTYEWDNDELAAPRTVRNRGSIRKRRSGRFSGFVHRLRSQKALRADNVLQPDAGPYFG